MTWPRKQICLTRDLFGNNYGIQELYPWISFGYSFFNSIVHGFFEGYHFWRKTSCTSLINYVKRNLLNSTVFVDVFISGVYSLIVRKIQNLSKPLSSLFPLSFYHEHFIYDIMQYTETLVVPAKKWAISFEPLGQILWALQRIMLNRQRYVPQQKHVIWKI